MQFEDLPNIGVVIEDLHPDFVKRLKKHTKILKKQFKGNQSPDLLHQFYLRGRIPHHDSSDKKSLVNTIFNVPNDLKNDIYKEVLKIINVYEKKYKYFSKLYGYMAGGLQHDENIYELESINVNIQRKGEFFPVHRHSGIYTFTIWVDIPFYKTKIPTEKVTNNIQVGATDLTGNLQFLYTDVLGKITTWNLPIDKNWEGKLCVFPAEMSHQVYPFFNSDDLRVIITGNISVSNTKIIPTNQELMSKTNIDNIINKIIIALGIILLVGFLTLNLL